MNKRNRGRILPTDGIAAVHTHLNQRGWSRQFYAHEVALSESTIARMLRGEPVDYKTLVAALSIFGLNVNAYQYEIERAEIVPPIPEGAITPPSDTLLSFYMDAIYNDTQTNQALMRCLVKVLQNYLIGENVDFVEKGGRVTVVGLFTPEKQGDIEVVLRQINEICTRMNLSINMSEEKGQVLMAGTI